MRAPSTLLGFCVSLEVDSKDAPLDFCVRVTATFEDRYWSQQTVVVSGVVRVPAFSTGRSVGVGVIRSNIPFGDRLDPVAATIDLSGDRAYLPPGEEAAHVAGRKHTFRGVKVDDRTGAFQVGTMKGELRLVNVSSI